MLSKASTLVPFFGYFSSSRLSSCLGSPKNQRVDKRGKRNEGREIERAGNRIRERKGKKCLFFALLPLDVRDLLELEVGRVGGEKTGCGGIGCREADLGVDVEKAVSAAGGPDGRRAVGFVVLEVVTSDRADKVVLSDRLVN